LPVDHHQPSWISETPLVFIGDWDAMPIFRRRIGGNPAWQEEAYNKEHSDEMVKKYKEMGVTMMLLHFYKGFGLEAEKEHIEEAKQLAAICKQNGLKVGVYVGSTIGYETLESQCLMQIRRFERGFTSCIRVLLNT
jgi:sugar phosphate isomerase/epimerase